MRPLILCLASWLALITLPASAQDYAVGDLHISEAWTRVMPHGHTMGGGYLEIRNEGERADRLVSAASPRAGRVEIHETTIVDDVMRMRELKEGLEIAPGGAAELKPGGLHLMFFDVETAFAMGEQIPVTLEFEHAGQVEIELDVRGRDGASGHGTH